MSLHAYGDFGSTGEIKLKPKHALLSESSSKLSKKLLADFDDLKHLKQSREQITSSDVDIVKQDVFRYRFKSLDLGDIYKIMLTFNQPNKKTPIVSSTFIGTTTLPPAHSSLVKMSWFLRKIEIKFDKRKFLFVYNKLITTDNIAKANRKCELRLLEQVMKNLFFQMFNAHFEFKNSKPL